jgi:hypothetical protein
MLYFPIRIDVDVVKTVNHKYANFSEILGAGKH